MAITQAEFDDLKARGYAAVLSKSVTLANAQIKALPTTPIEIVPAPGSGKAIKWLGAYLLLDSVAGPYTFPSGVPGADAFWQLCYTGGGNDIPYEASGLMNPSAGTQVTKLEGGFVPLGSWNSVESYLTSRLRGFTDGGDDLVENRALSIGDIYNGIDDYDGGDAANSLEVTVIYTIVDVS